MNFNMNSVTNVVNPLIKNIAKDHPVLSGILASILAAGVWIWESWQHKFLPEGECIVKKVYDGDTMTLDCAGNETKVRMYCIDAPEKKQDPWGELSRANLANLAGNSVRLKQIDKDRYNRVVNGTSSSS